MSPCEDSTGKSLQRGARRLFCSRSFMAMVLAAWAETFALPCKGGCSSLRNRGRFAVASLEKTGRRAATKLGDSCSRNRGSRTTPTLADEILESQLCCSRTRRKFGSHDCGVSVGGVEGLDTTAAGSGTGAIGAVVT